MGSGAFLVETCRQLGDELVKAWHVHNCAPKLPPDEDEVLHARRLIAQRCLYGVDKNPMAVDLAKLSLWLATLAKDHPFTFLDHSLRCGDSLVGLSREQIAAFHWQPPAKRAKDDVWFGDPIAERMRTVTEYRQRILAARDDKPYEQLRQELDVADEALSLARLAGNAVIAAYFSAGKDRERVAKLDTLARQLVKYLGPQGRIEDRQPLKDAVASLHGGDHPIQPFHWQIEFPEVFPVDAKGKPAGGFDAFVGNPPFAGAGNLSGMAGVSYGDFLRTVFDGTSGKVDLVAFFFRRAFATLRSGGALGLIATNTIAQGDTRTAALQWICQHGGTIFAATKRLKWPGEAAVVVSVVHITNGEFVGSPQLGGRDVDAITAFLFHTGGHTVPATLKRNLGRSFRGTVIWGSGFTFDDGSAGADCTSLAEMQELLTAQPRNHERIFPYMGGEELNESPTQTYRRYVINFGEMTESEARHWPQLLAIVERKVRPERQRHGGSLASQWWLFGRRNLDGVRAISGLSRVLAQSQVSSHLAFVFLPTNWVHAHTLNLFAFEAFTGFCVLQSRSHEIWARFFASSLEDRLRYTPSDCFETFPFPAGVLERTADGSRTTDNQLTILDSAGREYYEFRAALMVRNDEGLTKTYNRFHDPHETSPDILQLRALHAAMDRAVLEAYGWRDLAQTATCEFLLDYEDEEDDEQLTTDHGPRTSRRKKPWRYRWPDEFRDEVLARLLALNKERAEQERLAGQLSVDSGQLSGRKPSAKIAKPRKPRKPKGPALPGF